MMMVWAPMSLAATAPRRKLQVKIKLLKLEGLETDFWKEKIVMVGVNWKGEGRKLFVLPFSSRSQRRRDFSSQRILKNGSSCLEWNDQEFENTIVIAQSHKWDVSFSILYGEEANGKMVVTGKGCINLRELVLKREPQIEKKIPIKLKSAEFRSEAALSVLVSFVDLRDSQYSSGLLPPDIAQLQDLVVNGTGNDKWSKQQQPLRAQSARYDSDRSRPRLSSRSLRTQVNQAKKVPLFSWNFLKSNVERLNNKITGEDGQRIPTDQQFTDSSSVNFVAFPSKEAKVDVSEHSKPECQSHNLTANKWDVMDLVSRDGQTKLMAQVFLASFDQCSCKAAGESACTTLVAVISHWLFSNHDRMPTGTEFDSLIVDGSSEWRKLCDNEPIVNNFPDKHFDLETVLEAGIRPILISQEKSFVGFFSPEKFESLKGGMSFDEISNEIGNIEEKDQSRTYIVSWNDHFFVFKLDNEAYYIIDTLGERLYEGCKQAFILKFDKSTLMLDGKNDEEIICKGKDCCWEFIKRFLAAIPLRELEMEEEKQTVSYYSLHQRLQIEFNFLTLSSPLSPPFSSQSSDATVSISSLDFNENDSD